MYLNCGHIYLEEEHSTMYAKFYFNKTDLHAIFARFFQKTWNTILGTGHNLLSFNKVGTENILYCILLSDFLKYCIFSLEVIYMNVTYMPWM